jgi:hypothetical protein
MIIGSKLLKLHIKRRRLDSYKHYNAHPATPFSSLHIHPANSLSVHSHNSFVVGTVSTPTGS